jgi:hypothetical protein
MQHKHIIEKFGGVRPMATALEHKNPTTVAAWKLNNKIPRWRWHEVLTAARKLRLGIKETDLRGE